MKTSIEINIKLHQPIDTMARTISHLVGGKGEIAKINGHSYSLAPYDTWKMLQITPSKIVLQYHGRMNAGVQQGFKETIEWTFRD